MIEPQSFSATGPGQFIGDNSLLSSFSLEVDAPAGSGATWTVNLEGSLTGNATESWTPILTHTNTNPGNGLIESTGAGFFPCRFRRINVIALSLGTATSILVKIEGNP
jgi:hypothetical protein